MAKKNRLHFKSFLKQINTWYIQAEKREKNETKYRNEDIVHIKNNIRNKLKSLVEKETDLQIRNQILQKFDYASERLNYEVSNRLLYKWLDEMNVEIVYNTLKQSSFDMIDSMISQHKRSLTSMAENYPFSDDDS